MTLFETPRWKTWTAIFTKIDNEYRDNSYSMFDWIKKGMEESAYKFYEQITIKMKDYDSYLFTKRRTKIFKELESVNVCIKDINNIIADYTKPEIFIGSYDRHRISHFMKMILQPCDIKYDTRDPKNKVFTWSLTDIDFDKLNGVKGCRKYQINDININKHRKKIVKIVYSYISLYIDAKSLKYTDESIKQMDIKTQKKHVKFYINHIFNKVVKMNRMYKCEEYLNITMNIKGSNKNNNLHLMKDARFINTIN